jgi:hypothetical protein
MAFERVNPMRRRLLQPGCHSWLTTIICCVMALLTGSEHTTPFQRVVQQLLRPISSESETYQDEEGEAGKPAASSQATRRSFRKRSSSPTNQSHMRFLALLAHSVPTSPSLFRPATPAGELAYRNGAGAPLRC